MKIIENALDDNLFAQVQNRICGEDMAWHISRTYTGKQCNFFAKTIWEDDGSELASFVWDVASVCGKYAGKTKKDLQRVRLALYQKTSEKSIINTKHIDVDIPHTVALLYLNDADGDTIFYDGDEIVDRVTPKANQLLIFNGLRWHSSSSPTNTYYRYVMNINFDDPPNFQD